jgi:hypothetical protein
VIRENPDEVRRFEVEEISVHEASGEDVTASQPLHFGFVELLG